MTAMPVMIVVLCLMAIAYRYYSAFLAAKVATLDASRQTPAYQFNDGQNFHPTNKWVLFGHHFAAISGAGPLIGPVLAAQFGYMPGLLWLVIGVCLGGAMQDFMVLAASMRRGGRSLAQIAFNDIGKVAGTACTSAILIIIVIALAGLGKAVVKALGGEPISYPAGTTIALASAPGSEPYGNGKFLYRLPEDVSVTWPTAKHSGNLGRGFTVITLQPLHFEQAGERLQASLPPDSKVVSPGSAWGTFTIACTIPITLLVGLWMYKIRPGHVVEASLIGGTLTLVATFIGGFVAESSWGHLFALKDTTVVAAMASYGFIASILPVWVLLCPRDYLSSFLKLGTIALIVGGVLIGNPRFETPAINQIFISGGPAVAGKIFPFLFITIMCGAISGFHTLVSSGTTPKMIRKESDARLIGYGSMLIEGLVGVCAMIAAAALPMGDYYAMNTDLATVPKFQDRFVQIGADMDHLNGPGGYEERTQESLRGRTGGAVTLAVGMAHIFDGIPRKLGMASETALLALWKYWYHFAIMFEALFILTTIDTGTRIGRFLLQEIMGKTISPQWGKTDWWPSAILSTVLICAGWGYFIQANSFAAIWPMFGIGNQMLSVIALAVVSVYLVNSGKTRYLWVTVLPLCFVMTTTSTAAVYMFIGQLDTFRTQLANGANRDLNLLINSAIQGPLILVMLGCAIIVIIASAIKIWNATGGFKADPGRGFEPVLAGK